MHCLNVSCARQAGWPPESLMRFGDHNHDGIEMPSLRCSRPRAPTDGSLCRVRLVAGRCSVSAARAQRHACRTRDTVPSGRGDLGLGNSGTLPQIRTTSALPASCAQSGGCNAFGNDGSGSSLLGLASLIRATGTTG
jgi:hypothetical protein